VNHGLWWLSDLPVVKKTISFEVGGVNKALNDVMADSCGSTVSVYSLSCIGRCIGSQWGKLCSYIIGESMLKALQAVSG
jgi:hypothetical protein